MGSLSRLSIPLVWVISRLGSVIGALDGYIMWMCEMGEGSEPQELLNKINVGHDHPSATVSLAAELVHRITILIRCQVPVRMENLLEERVAFTHH